ncbi:solute carrier family 23 member 1-like [Biomphalaria glabrata]|uniref:Solute carrier family 23 member 1-like n=1 Tax=Biomphalaria glabrata TaxID=6526 RepID=A0A9W3AQL3_BIOGL|nr:solute carrier family 23 member 1-like [Biomphalaria glabrata]
MDPLISGEGDGKAILSSKNAITPPDHKGCLKPETRRNSSTSNLSLYENRASVEIVGTDGRHDLIYTITETPPVYLLLLFAIQQCLLSIVNPLSKAIIVSEVVCATKDDAIKAQLLSATLLMTGVATFLMSTVGVRLPIFQGPASSYMVPLISLMTLEEWKCPEPFQYWDESANRSVWMANIGNETVPMKDVITDKILKLSGSLMIAGFLHTLIGLTGFVGVIIRYVGPVTVVPTVILVGLEIKTVAVKFSETNWTVAIITAGSALVFSLFLANRKTPIPFWTKKKGFHIFWYPFHQVFSILLSILLGWLISGIMTVFGALSNDPKSKDFFARTDARAHVIHDIDWFIFPYPGMFGMVSFSLGGFISFFVATILSVLDSIGDYNACARTARVPPPPPFAFNRGIAVEGFVSFIGGTLGCCHATSSYGGNIGAMGITRVASRSVFQVAGIIYILFAILGKFGAVFVTIPYSVLGGCNVIIMGIFIGVILSYLQTVDLNSTRNLAIMGISLLLGVMMPLWVSKNPHAFNTGDATLDSSLKMLLTNPSFVGGVFAFLMDNTAPGTLKERGLLHFLKSEEDEVPKAVACNDLKIYRLPFVPDSFRRSRIAKYIPVVHYTGKK